MPTRRAERYTRYTTPHPTTDPHHSYSPAPGLALEMAAQGVDLRELGDITGYPVEYLRKLRDEGLVAPRIVTSRISAALGVEHTVIRGEQQGEVTRIRDVIIPGERAEERGE